MAKSKKKKIEFGSMVHIPVLNASGVVTGKLGTRWLVHFVNGTTMLFAAGDLEVID